MNTNRSPEQQVASLRPTLAIAARFHWWLLGGAAAGVMAAVALWHPVPLMIGLFLGLVGLGSQRAGPNIVAALSAWDSGTPSQGEVSIGIRCWDMDDHFYATLHEAGQQTWHYEFIPQRWRPVEGLYPARIWRSAETGMPVLATTAQGLMIPRDEPEPVTDDSTVSESRSGP